MHDFLLAEQAKRGNRDALEKLVKKYYHLIYNYIFYRVSDRETAEDLTQDTFYKLTGCIHRYVPAAKFSTFLYQIAHNTVIDYYRRVKPELGDVFEQRRESTEAETEHVEKKLDVASILRKIPQEQQECVILHYYQELKYTEIADVLGIPVSTAKTRVRRGLQNIKEIMEQEGFHG